MVVGGCGPPTPEATTLLESGFEARVAGVQGCGDAVLHALSFDGDVALDFRVDGVAAEAHAIGDATSFVFDLADEAVLSVAIGNALQIDPCSGQVSGQVDHVLEPVTGDAILTVIPKRGEGPDATRAHAVLVLERVELSDGAGGIAELDRWEGSADIGQ